MDSIKTPNILNENELEKTSLNFEALRQKGLDIIQALSGDEWTDYNEHDPGVTILEQVCYALTDVAYRTSFPVSNLLARPDGPVIDYKKNAFYPPASILSSHPVTISDIRKSIIDQFDEIRNAWVLPQNPLNFEEKLRGLYKVELLPTLTFLKKIGKGNGEEVETLINKVRNFLHGNRSIGEDFGKPYLLKSHEIEIKLKIHLSGETKLEYVVADLFYRLFEYFYCPVTHYSFSQLTQKGLTVNEIFSGPKLRQEFTRSDELQERPTVIYAEELQRFCVGKVPEILHCEIEHIKTLQSRKDLREQDSNKELSVHHEHFFHIKIDDSFETLFKNLQVIVRGEKVANYNKSLVERVFLEKWSKKYRNYKTKGWTDDYVAKKLRATYYDPAKYLSIQHHFPLIYGIGNDGIPTHEPPERHAKAKQLQAYLLFFEQQMANQLSQIGNLTEFFNVDYGHCSKHTYFTQKVLLPSSGSKEDPTGTDNPLWKIPFEKSLENLMETKEDFLDRKNKVYDHLLARFGEDLNELPWQVTPQYHPNESVTLFNEALLDVSKKIYALTKEKKHFMNALALPQLKESNAKLIGQLRRPCSEDYLDELLLRKKSEFLLNLDTLSYYRNKGESFSTHHKDLFLKKVSEFTNQLKTQLYDFNYAKEELEKSILIMDDMERLLSSVNVEKDGSPEVSEILEQIRNLKKDHSASKKLTKTISDLILRTESMDTESEGNDAGLEKIIRQTLGINDREFLKKTKGSLELERGLKEMVGYDEHHHAATTKLAKNIMKPLELKYSAVRNPSGLERLISLKTGIPIRGDQKISDTLTAVKSRYPQLFTKKLGKVIQDEHHRPLKYIERYTSSFNTSWRNVSEPEFMNMDIKVFFNEALDFDNYKITDYEKTTKASSKDSKTPEITNEILFKNNGDWVKILEKENTVEAVRNIHYIIDSVTRFNEMSEGFYLIDHILFKDILEADTRNFGFSFLDEYGKNVFESNWCKDNSVRDQKLKQFYELGLSKNNFVFNDGTWNIINCPKKHEFQQVIEQKLAEFVWLIDGYGDSPELYVEVKRNSKTLAQIQALLTEYDFEKVLGLNRTKFQESLQFLDTVLENEPRHKATQLLKDYLEGIDKLVGETNHISIIKRETMYFLKDLQDAGSTHGFTNILEDTFCEFLDQLEPDDSFQEIHTLFNVKMHLLLKRAKKRNIANPFVDELTEYLKIIGDAPSNFQDVFTNVLKDLESQLPPETMEILLNNTLFRFVNTEEDEGKESLFEKLWNWMENGAQENVTQKKPVKNSKEDFREKFLRFVQRNTSKEGRESEQNKDEKPLDHVISFSGLLYRLKIFFHPKSVSSFIAEFIENDEKVLLSKLEAFGVEKDLLEKIKKNAQQFLESIEKLEKENKYRNELKKDISKLLTQVRNNVEINAPFKETVSYFLDCYGNYKKYDDTHDREVLASFKMERGTLPYENSINQPYHFTKDLIHLFNDEQATYGRLRLEELESIRWVGVFDAINKPRRQKRLIFRTKLDDRTLVDESFFDSNISIVLPDWPARFQDERFRVYFKDVVLERIPAHIGCRFYWLDVQEMKKFEAIYSKWEKVNYTRLKKEYGDRTEKAFAVYDYMSKLQNTVA